MMHLNKSEAKPKHRSFHFEAIGTHWHISYVPQKTDSALLEKQIINRIEAFDKTYSRFREDSIVHDMSQHGGTFEFPDDAEKMFEFYRQLYVLTNGAVTPLIGSTLSDAGYDADYSLRFKHKTIAPPLEVLNIAKTTIAIKTPVLLDFGGAGKGYLVDIISELMKSAGIPEAVIDAGGDIVVFSTIGHPSDIALQHPENRDLAVGVAHIVNQSLCGSSILTRNWGSHHHIINPHSGESPLGIQALWVTSESGLLADGIATALFFVSPDQLKPHFSFEYAIIKQDNSLEYSEKFPATFFETP